MMSPADVLRRRPGNPQDEHRSEDTKAMSTPIEHVADFIEIVGRAHVLTQRDLATRDPGVDPHNLLGDLLIRPATTTEVADVLKLCHEHHLPVVPQGGRTGISGGAVSAQGQIILSLERMNRIEHLDPISRTIVVQAGVTLGAVSAACAPHGLTPGIDLGARDSATMGGMVSTNAGGSQAFRFGTMRERVLGLEVVLADGRILSELGEVRKRNEGPAIERLFIGAEGLLGIITRVSLALVDADGPLGSALIAVADPTTLAALAHRLQTALSSRLSALEVMSGNHAVTVCRALGFTEFDTLCQHALVLLLEATGANAEAAESALLSTLEPELASGAIADALIAQNEAQRHTMWRIREDWAVDRERPGGLWYDISVPLSRLGEYLDAFTARIEAHDPTLSVYMVGHLADGNIHLTVNAPAPITPRYEEIAALVTMGLKGMGGSFSAEHGIGLEKKATLSRELDPLKQRLITDVKRLLDPHGILNPGKVI